MFLSILESTGLIILVILFFNFMIFFHELGHFLAGKWRGAYIDRFQIWFGKPIWKKKMWGVEWGLGWIPAGGFVSLPQLEDMESIEGEAKVDKAALKPLKPKDKVIIAAAGPLFSLLFAYICAVVVFIAGKPVMKDFGTTIGYTIPDYPAVEAGLLPGDKVTAVDGQKVEKWAGNMEGLSELIALSEHEKITLSIERTGADGSVQEKEIEVGYKLPETKWWQRSGLRTIGILPVQKATILKVVKGSPAARAGITPGQEIIKVNGQRVYTPYAVTEVSKEGKPMTLTLRNEDGSEQEVSLTPEIPTNWEGQEGAHPVLGIQWDPTREILMENPTPQQQVNDSLRFMKDTLVKLCAPKSSVGMQHLSGPVGIGNALYRMLETGEGNGWRLMLWFAVVINVNLAVLNMLPLPVVDGGHVVLGFAEMVRRKPVSSKILNWIFTIFIFLLLAMFLFVTFKDVGDLVGGGDSKQQLPDAEFSTKAE